MRGESIRIVGGGLAGSLLALLLARRGHSVRLYERRADPGTARSSEGRSINLALAARGRLALERAGVLTAVEPLLIGMRGRMVHERSGHCALQPYGQTDEEVIYSVGRAALNKVLIAAAREAQVELLFEQACLGVDLAANVLKFRDERSGRQYEEELSPTVATDGAGSTVRASLAAAGQLRVREDRLDHDYKELGMPAREGRHALEPHALHVWPRGGFMLIALPNTDGSFTATLFLARTGAMSFASLSTPESVRAFFSRDFPDVLPLMPDLLTEFTAHPQGTLATVHAAPWQVGGKLLLLGDAAHAIVPFHGQGMNAAFEDCVALDDLLRDADWPSAIEEFERRRRPSAAAIAQMALENYVEMRDSVLDPAYQHRKTLALELERCYPDRFIPRYSMVMFHPEIPYDLALRRGQIQADILKEPDRRRMEELILERLPPLR